MSSIGFFDTLTQAEESTRVAANWVREEKLESALPNPPKVTGGEVIVKEVERRPRVNSEDIVTREKVRLRAFLFHTTGELERRPERVGRGL
jgi:hypothetical protein